MLICGTVEKIIYKNSDNGYTVLQLEVNEGELIAVGTMPLVAEGEQIEVEGEYTTHTNYGKQFSVKTFMSKLPANETAILKYLSSGIVHGVRIKTAKLLVDKFGSETLEIMENDPTRLLEIKGISPKRAEKISQNIKETMGVKSILLYFQQFGIIPSAAFKIYKQWGLRAYDILRENPYRLCEIPGIGFETADKVAEKMKYDRGSINRLQAGIIYILNYNLYNNGHTFLPKKKLATTAADLLDSDEATLTENINELIDDQVLIWQENIANTDGVYLRWVYECEKEVTARILLASRFNSEYKGDFEKDIKRIEVNIGISFAEKQKKAVYEACKNQIMVLTGGPGTGKTTTLNGIIRLYENMDISFALAAPTGRAAKRMTELTGREAKTIHRLLDYYFKDGEYVFGQNKDNPLEYDAVIIDESSMVDLPLLYRLFDALSASSKLILVGDSAQLPPVGPGRIFKDIIDSGVVATVELSEIFRQAAESFIVTNAHKILHGQLPDITQKNGDFFFIRNENPEEVAKLVCDLCSQRLPDAYGYMPMTDIQTLSPTRKGACGTVTLNKLLQERLNPPSEKKKELLFRGTLFREGDKVMQVKNNYDLICEKPNGDIELGVFNGDVGIIKEISNRDETVKVKYDNDITEYTVENLEELELAYAVTVHKSQGSEFDAVVLVLSDGSDLLFTRNLLYTAVTRARKLLVVVGSPSRIKQMVENVRSDKRFTGLKYRLMNMI